MSSFSHLAVGSEIIIGQILNTSSQWLSLQCEKIGLTSDFHLSVADDRQKMITAANFLASQSDLIFVTGGLGPTSDDFTREIIAQVTQKPLIWSDLAWNHLVNYLNTRQTQIRENHKQECYFPEGSDLFFNPIGTACGFAVRSHNKLWIVLPGPPRELQAMWDDQIKPYLLKSVADLDPMIVWSAYVFGLPESGVAELLSPQLLECPFEVGYRIHLPYIEFKLRFPTAKMNEAQTWIQIVETTLQNQKVVPNLNYLLDRTYLNLTAQLGQLPETIVVLNPNHRPELDQRFGVSNLLTNQVIRFKYDQLNFSMPHLAFEWSFDLEQNQCRVEIMRDSCGSLKTLLIESPLNRHFSVERRVKDLIERALFELSSISLT
jgi:molybdenum cofactor synthesis domain-containing protein